MSYGLSFNVNRRYSELPESLIVHPHTMSSRSSSVASPQAHQVPNHSTPTIAQFNRLISGSIKIAHIFSRSIQVFVQWAGSDKVERRACCPPSSYSPLPAADPPASRKLRHVWRHHALIFGSSVLFIAGIVESTLYVGRQVV